MDIALCMSISTSLEEQTQIWTVTCAPTPRQVALLRQEIGGHFYVTCEQVLRVMECFLVSHVGFQGGGVGVLRVEG